MDISDFPIGCKVSPANKDEAYFMSVNFDNVATVVDHDSNGIWLHIKWEQTEDREIGLWDFRRFRLISTNGKEELNRDLKSMNTDGRTTCAACGCQLKDPGMGLTYRYCPKCEP